jgi:hypothetical protein
VEPTSTRVFGFKRPDCTALTQPLASGVLGFNPGPQYAVLFDETKTRPKCLLGAAERLNPTSIFSIQLDKYSSPAIAKTEFINLSQHVQKVYILGAVKAGTQGEGAVVVTTENAANSYVLKGPIIARIMRTRFEDADTPINPFEFANQQLRHMP